ncbi:hypothetical protein [Sandaracinus amylolyticus]|uniref:DUF4139 domain-containing protein n=1 Tax=Sandaracinus amylolyticus TaxID=927083 RepID=A0A0F6W6Z9_9BACT|nr:hypothetical protein [Sandaracinus amylolyticus]AKF09100.1 hypothetical protein DB32_006249 [Sandaracinus amylolyticus]
MTTTNAKRPTVQRMVLFKHGVAHVERGGPCEGSFELSFEREEMKDVLKSLAVWVAAGDARPTAIAFDKPDDPERALAARGLVLPPEESFSALLTAFRGRRVSVKEDQTTITGEVIGLEMRRVDQGVRPLVALRVERGAIRVVDLERVREVLLDDPVAAADLELLLDRRRAASSHERRSVRIGVDGRADDLRVSYVVPAPVWRVSYRIVAAATETVVSAWAIVHNPLDEDVEDVALTLTTGQPISFDIDLYRPKTVQRVVVEESSRAASAPTQYERAPRVAKALAPAAAPAGFGGPPAAPMMAAVAAPPPPPQPGMPAQAMFQAADGAALLEDRGELFEYRIAQPITLPRGGSALAPLLAAPAEARKERIWRAGTPPTPDLVLSFDNHTGAVLEEGPAVIYDEGVYAGEAMVPYTVRGASVKLAYAKDLAVRCKHESSTRWVATGVRLADRFLAEEQRIEDRHVLRADSDHDEEVEVVFELPKRNERRLADRTAKPFEETASWRRFRAKVPPRGHVELEVVELGHGSRRIEYASLSPAQLSEWLRVGVLEGPLADALSEIVSAWAEATAHDARAHQLEQQRAQVQQGQSKISEQLQVLREGGAEGELRLRYVRELGQAQDRVNALEQDAASARAAADAARKRAETRLAQVLGRPPR